MSVRATIKSLAPPIFLTIFKKQSPYGYFKNYKTWRDALNDSTGYDNPVILEKVKDSLLKVKNGLAVYERDSVLFNKIEYSWPVLSGLLWIASLNKNKLTVFDFGGSLGSSYFQNKSFLKHLDLKWYISEQKKFVQYGKKYFEDGVLEFIDDATVLDNVSVFLASSSIQYIEDPYKLMGGVIETGYPYIIIDRCAFLPNSERITVQKVRPEIYDASYPAWFLNEEKFLGLFRKEYTLVSDFSSIGSNKIDLGNTTGYLKGFIFRKI